MHRKLANIRKKRTSLVYPEDTEMDHKNKNNETELHNYVRRVCLGRGAFSSDELRRLAKDAEVKDDNGMTALHFLAYIVPAPEYSTQIVQILLEAGAKIDEPDSYGRTPLHYAVARDNVKIFHLLLELGADFEATTKEGQTILHLAARYDSIECLHRIFLHLEKGFIMADKGQQHILSRLKTLPPGWKLSHDSRSFLERGDNFQRTALHVAAAFDMSMSAELLLKLGANPGVGDIRGNTPLTLMIETMPHLAKLALDQFVTVDKAARKRRFVLAPLENCEFVLKNQSSMRVSQSQADMKNLGLIADRDKHLVKTALEQIVNHNTLNLIVHPIIAHLVKRKWIAFGRKGVFIQTIIYLIFLFCYTFSATSSRSDQLGAKYEEALGWGRIVTDLLAVILICYFIGDEIKEIVWSFNRFKRYRAFRNQEIEEQLAYVPANKLWPDHEYLTRLKEKLNSKSVLGKYATDPWNIFDWINYLLVTATTFSHIANIIVPGHETVHYHIRLLSVSLIFSWLKLLKFARAFEVFGPFVVMLGKMMQDVFRWIFLYVDLLIPFACAFHLIFGHNNEDFNSFYESMMSMFRMSVIDFEWSTLLVTDKWMAYLLVSTWIFVSGILFINLFIAMMSTTFQIVYDNAHSVASMQHAQAVMGIQEKLPKAKLLAHRQEILNCGGEDNPDEEDYDDDQQEEADQLVNLREQIAEDLGDVRDELQATKELLENIKDLLDSRFKLASKPGKYELLQPLKVPKRSPVDDHEKREPEN